MSQPNRRSGPGPSDLPSVGSAGRSVLEGAFGLLGVLERAGEAGLNRLASESGLPKTTAHRLLEQLAGLGAVERCRGGYRMGPRMFHLGQGWQPYPGLRAAARDPIRRLAAATGTAVAINSLSEGRTLVLAWSPGSPEQLGPLRDHITAPWFAAAGKVLVAAAYPVLPPGPLPATWRQESAAIRERGVAFDREELVAGVCCVAVPLYGAGHMPVASLSVVTDPSHRLHRLADIVERTGRAISARLHRRQAAPWREAPSLAPGRHFPTWDFS